MRTEEINIYTFSELSEKVQQKVLEKRRYWDVEHDWSEHIIDAFKEDHPQYEDCEISFSGFYSQGDGASFTFRLDSAYFEKWVEALEIPEWKKAVLVHYTPQFTGKRNTHYYSHKFTVTTDFDFTYHGGLYTNIDEFRREKYDEFLEVLQSEVYSHCDELYRTLEKEYDYLTSDEYIIEEMEDCEFYENGETY
jgi:hypothetical protein